MVEISIDCVWVVYREVDFKASEPLLTKNH